MRLHLDLSFNIRLHHHTALGLYHLVHHRQHALEELTLDLLGTRVSDPSQMGLDGLRSGPLRILDLRLVDVGHGCPWLVSACVGGTAPQRLRLDLAVHLTDLHRQRLIRGIQRLEGLTRLELNVYHQWSPDTVALILRCLRPGLTIVLDGQESSPLPQNACPDSSACSPNAPATSRMDTCRTCTWP